MSEQNNLLAGRAVIVTGGNSGIGRAIALEMAAKGAQVVIAARNSESNAAVVKEIRDAGGEALAFTYDAQSAANADELVQFVVDNFGDPQICVANAGGMVGGSKPLIEMSDEMWRGTMALNLDAPFFLYRAVARQLIASGKPGSLIGISSVASLRSSPSLHYATAKGGLNAMTTNLSVQLGSHGIRTNAILPGPIETPAFQQGASEELRQKLISKVPVGRVGLPEDIASLAVYLASDAAEFINGQLIVVDGGMIQS